MQLLQNLGVFGIDLKRLEANSIHIHKDLIISCKTGDQKAFKQLYMLYAKSMFNVALRIVKYKDEAEDVTQEAFIKAYYKINQFDFQATFGAWLKKIVVNQALDLLRRESKWDMDQIGEESISEESEIDWEGIDLQVDLVKKAIRNLPSGFRTVATLYLFEGFEHKEIAEILSISVNTSKSQFHRAKKRIKDFIQDYEKGNRQTGAIYQQ
ncbi:RNA polymerase sigma-70 factor, ECF subfamily [Marivirga sericea]|uniref:RNA polymerase sigma factor n=1 Tax=Marivirga sericea TaxID=1028 RepID=A0A1X7K8C8_9BACT|nr:sigma-70 family RNA polymerase sigma factor [Marivirga sericea]SMG37318.1 RNA polymerase sigma-70 factor, ECF subfamily [Marivirga sericea]